MKLLLQSLFIVRKEVEYLLLHPKTLLTSALVVFVPALYCILYIASVWDTEQKTGALPVAVVNLDEGVNYRDHTFNVGWEITTRLEDSKRFGFVVSSDEQKARTMVRQGKLAFAVIIPRDFSASAVPGAEAGAGKVVVYTSQGNNYETAAIARHFAETLGSQINENLNERRWELVLHNAAGSQRNVDSLRKAVDKLRVSVRELGTGAAQTSTAAQSLASGARRLSDGVGQMSAGAKQLGGPLRAMDAIWPSNTDLSALTNRMKALMQGHAEMDRTMEELQRVSLQLRERATALSDEAKNRRFVGSDDPGDLGRLAASMTQLEADIKAANATQRQLATTATRLRNSVNTLARDMRAMGADERTVASKFPKETQFDELTQGATDVAASAANLMGNSQRTSQSVQHLNAGVDLLAKALPEPVESLGGSAEGLANSVEPVVEIDAPVENSGSGFASNIVPGSLWLGAALAAYLIHIRVLPRHAQFFSRPAKVAGKIFLPACLVLLQALFVFIAVRYVLQIHIVLQWALVLTLIISALTFLFIVFALAKAFGDAGRGIAMCLLAVQLSSSGGILPVELSGGLFAQISPWLPLTWVIESIKASMFGAYGGAWKPPLTFVVLVGLAAFALSCGVGRWRFVKPPYTPARPRG